MDDTVREDIGYREGEMKDQVYPQRVRFQVEKKRIRYTQGELKGQERELNVAIADDLIERGFAVSVSREAGEEG
jgi:flagellar basal body rod protein FlgF